MSLFFIENEATFG